MVFLKTLTAEYLRLCGYKIDCEDGILDINEAPSAGETANDFIKTETAVNRRIQAGKNLGLHGRKGDAYERRLAYHRPCQVIHFELNSLALKAAAKEKMLQ
jgi:hypothetical protein